MTADTTLSGASARPISPCEDLGYIVSDAAVTLFDGFAAILNCCNGIIVKPSHRDERSCCTTVTWGPDEVRYMEDVTEEMSLPEEPVREKKRLAKMKKSDSQVDRDRSPSPEWENFDHFVVNQEDIEVWNNDTEENQRMIEAAFSSDLSTFSSFVAAPDDVTIEDASVKSSNSHASNTSGSCKKKIRSCACCGKINKKETPVKLKICSRCKTTFYCSLECQRVDWHYGHKNKCRAQVLL